MKVVKTNNPGKPWCVDTRRMENGVTKGGRYFFKTKERAKLEMEHMQKFGEPKKRKDSNDSDLTVEEVYKKYAVEYCGKKKARKLIKNRPSTNRDKVSRYDHHLSGFFGDMLISEVDVDTMALFSTYVQDLTNKEGDPISDALMYRLWRDTKSMLRWAFEKKFKDVLIVPREEDEIYKPDEKKPKCWSDEEFNMFIKCVDNEFYKTIFYTLALCGLRKSELRGLKFKNVNFVCKEIYIESQLVREKEGDVALKTKHSERTVHAPDIVMDALYKLKEKMKRKGVNDDEIGEMYVFFTNNRLVVPAETLRRHYKKAIHKSGVRDFPLHFLRHYFTSMLLKNGATIMYVQDELGHSRSDTTILRYYASVTEEEKKRNVEMVNRQYKKEDIEEEKDQNKDDEK